MKNIRWQELIPGSLIIFMFGMAVVSTWGWHTAWASAFHFFYFPVLALLVELIFWFFLRKFKPYAKSQDVLRIAMAGLFTGSHFLVFWIIQAVPVAGQFQHFSIKWWIQCVDIILGIFFITVGAVAGKSNVSSSLKGKTATIYNWFQPSWENASSFARGRSYRLQGWLLISTGALTLLVCLINAPVAFLIGISGALATPLIGWSYSYYVWRTEPT